MSLYNANRPEETALERIEWLGLYGVEFDVAGDPEPRWPVMDACDYRGQLLSTVAMDCTEATGRSYWVLDNS